MAYSRVDLVAQDSIEPLLLEGAAFKVLSADGFATVGVWHTGFDGKASFLLPDGEYEVRAFRFGYTFGQPQRIKVLNEDPISDLAALPLNTFVFKGTSQRPSVPLDRRFCVASGYFRHAGGLGYALLSLTFTPRFSPLIVDGMAMLTESTRVITSRQGYAEAQLIRGAEYTVEVDGVEQLNRVIYVPDEPSWSLTDLLFPRVDAVLFAPPLVEDTITMRVGQTVVVEASAHTTDGRSLCDMNSHLCWRLEDHRVAAIEVQQFSLRLRGARVGTTWLYADRMSTSILAIPNRPIANTPVRIVVTP